MPDDSIPVGQSDDKGDEGKTGTPPAGGDLAAQLQQALEAQQQQMVETLRQFGTALVTAIDEKIAGAAQPQQAQPAGDNDNSTGGGSFTDQQIADMQARLLTDPEGFISEILEKKLSSSRKEPDPVVKTLAEDKFATTRASLQREVDTQFGDGTFEELFSKEFDALAANLPDALKASETHLRVILNSLMGPKRTELNEREAAVQKERDRTMASPGTFTGMGRPRPRGSSLTPEEKEFLAELRDAGIDVDEKQYIRDREAAAAGHIDADTFPEEKETAQNAA